MVGLVIGLETVNSLGSSGFLDLFLMYVDTAGRPPKWRSRDGLLSYPICTV